MTHAVPSRRALIVDDEFLIAFDLEESMRDLGFEICDLAPTAKKAMDLAVTNQPDVVLMDVYLGGTRDGIEAGRWLREVCDASVVFVTWEYPLYLFVLCIAQAMLGDGAYALAPSRLSASGVTPRTTAEAQ